MGRLVEPALLLMLPLAGWWAYRWQGLVFGFSAMAFWLVLQFSRTMRVLKRASAAPAGRVASAVMLHSRLHAGMRMSELLALSGSLGRAVIREPGGPECWQWEDGSGAVLQVTMHHGRLRAWALDRPPEAPSGGP
jgi:hypothetical protein